MRWVRVVAVALLFAAGDAAAAPTTDLRDPFTARAAPDGHAVRAAPDLRDPFTGRVDARAAEPVPGDLHDPFARRPGVARGAPQQGLRDPFGPAPAPRTPRRSQPADDDLGLKNPFREPPARPRRAVAANVEQPTHGDLKNPFTRRTPPVKPVRPAVAGPLRPLRTPAIRRPSSVPLQRPRSVARPTPAR